jgi:hypothetical protein
MFESTSGLDIWIFNSLLYSTAALTLSIVSLCQDCEGGRHTLKFFIFQLLMGLLYTSILAVEIRQLQL